MEFISVMEMIGTVAFACSGALVAIEKELDHYGILFLAIITAVGGGIVRDTMINADLPVALENPIYVIVSAVTGIIVIGSYKRFVRLERIMKIFDALGLAAFTAIGAEAALSHHVYTPFVVITLAILTGTGGGLLRDVLAQKVPMVLQREVYSVASILGALTFLAAYAYWGKGMAMYLCFGVTAIVRLVAIKMNLHLARVRTQEDPVKEQE